MVVFVSKPEDYMIALDENKVPRFSYIHQPNGSPEFLQEYEGTKPTGPLPFPTYFLPGNHDINFDSTNDRYHLETYKRHFGSPYHSFDYGRTHFVVFDNIRHNVDEGFEGTYNGRVTDEQLEGFANDLRHVDPDKLIVLGMHIGLSNYIDRDAEQHTIGTQTRKPHLLQSAVFS